MNGIDLKGVAGTGARGRIRKEDVFALLPDASARPQASLAQNTDNTPQIVEMDKIRKVIAKRLTEAKSTIPHFYIRSDFDVENLFFSMIANIPMMDPSFSANWFRSQIDFMTDRTKIWKYEDGMGENFVSWLSGIMGVDLEFDEDIEYPKSRDEGNKLKKTPKLIHNLRQLYRKDIELYYPELEA